MKNFSLIILLVAIVMSFSAVFVVPEGQKAIVLLFSKVEKTVKTKRLYTALVFI